MTVEVGPWQEARLKCAIGHRYAGRVRRVREEGHDMDGESFLKSASDEYDPATCVVCGLKTWAKDSERTEIPKENGTSQQGHNR